MPRLVPFQDFVLPSRSGHAAGPSPRLGLELATGFAALLAASVLAGQWLEASRTVPLAAMATYLVLAGLIVRRLSSRDRELGWANRVTLARGVLVALLTGAVTDPGLLATQGNLLAVLALTALLLDGLDGWVARRSGTTSPFGARFDMELDAFFILVLCLALLVLDKAGAWILAIGAMRYAFVLAGLHLPWLNATLPESRRRQAVCVWQVAALMIGLLPAVDATAAAWLAATALAGLVGSFGADIRWLHRHARRG